MKMQYRLAIVLFLASGGLSTPVFASEIQFKVSKMHGLFGFVLAIAGEPHRPPGLSQLFEKSRHATEKSRLLLADWQKLRPSLNRGTSPPENKIRQGTNQVLIQLFVQSVRAKSLQEMSKKTEGLLSPAEHKELFRILQNFEPVYEDLVWKKSLPDLQKTALRLKELTKKINFETLFNKVARFYKANWPRGRPFTVGLYAIPFLQGESNLTNSQSMGDFEEHGVLTSGRKWSDAILADEFAIIMHEICHALYDSQSRVDADKLDQDYISTLPPHGVEAAKWINEALATAIGNGWIYGLLSKKDERKDWYADQTIDRFARQIFPLIKNYLDEDKPIDTAFVKASVQSFKDKSF